MYRARGPRHFSRRVSACRDCPRIHQFLSAVSERNNTIRSVSKIFKSTLPIISLNGSPLAHKLKSLLPAISRLLNSAVTRFHSIRHIFDLTFQHFFSKHHPIRHSTTMSAEERTARCVEFISSKLSSTEGNCQEAWRRIEDFYSKR